MDVGDHVRVSHRQNWLAGELEVAKIVSISPARTVPGMGLDAATFSATATVEYPDGTISGPLALDSFQPLPDLDDLNERGRDAWDVHLRIVRELEDAVSNRDWWLWLHLDEVVTGIPVTGLAEDVEQWLAQNPDHVGRVIEREYIEGGLAFRLRALPRKVEFRGDQPLVGNPFPAIAVWTGN